MCVFDPFLSYAFHRFFGGRGDGNPALRYLQPEDYGISSTPFSFLSGKWTLRGERYFASPGPYRGLVIFFHGLSAGRSSYTGEIALLAKAGYLVMAYDNTGCMESEGPGMNGLPQATLDQEAFFAYLDAQEDLSSLRRFAIGHSWGGYMALMALRPEYRVEKAVSAAGFFSLDHLVATSVPQLAFLQRSVRGYVKRKYGKASAKSALDYVKETQKPVLYLQGDKDPVVPTSGHFDYLKAHQAEYPNVTLYSCAGRAHQAFWSVEAQRYFTSLFGDKGERDPSLEEMANIDYQRLCEDDPKVFKTILDFFAA